MEHRDVAFGIGWAVVGVTSCRVPGVAVGAMVHPAHDRGVDAAEEAA